MEQTFNALGGLILNALPTLFIIICLHFYLKAMFFRPLERVLRARYEATEGARKLAEESLAKAEQKAGEFEAAIRAARAEIYREQENARQEWRNEHTHAIQTARQKAEETVARAKKDIAADAEAARRSLAQESERLALEIVNAILQRRAA